MINYYYIYYNKKTNNFISDELHEKILNIIMNYHYPCCLSSLATYTADEEDRIINDEFGLIKELVGKIDPDVEIFQIPRLIYDLFHAYGLKKQMLDDILPKNVFFGHDYISMNPSASQYENYCKFTWDNTMTSENIKLIKTINDIAYIFIKSYYPANINNLNFIQWERILKLLITYLANKYKHFQDKILDEYFIISDIIEEYLRSKYINLVELVSDGTRYQNEYLNSFFVYLEKKLGGAYNTKNIRFIEIFLDIVKYYVDKEEINESELYYRAALYILFNEDNIRKLLNENRKITKGLFPRLNIFISYEKEYLLNENNLKLLKQVLLDEIGVHIYKKNINHYFIMYRGLITDNDNVIDRDSSEFVPKSYSLSFNSSLLNGYWSDETACTYFYMTNNPDTLKYRYLYEKRLNRFNRQHIFDTEYLFFIPPLHPILQLSSSGEFWHIRTLVGKDSSIHGIKSFANIFDDYNNYKYFPTFLRSLLDTYIIAILYKKFIKARLNNFNKVDISKYINEERELFIKYLSYKQKYLTLKQNIKL